jgi:hypothetical protein
MQTKSQDRERGNVGSSYPRRKPRFSSSTKGIRLLPAQVEWVNSELEKDPEETWSRMVREGLNLLRKKREGLIQELAPVSRP